MNLTRLTIFLSLTLWVFISFAQSDSIAIKNMSVDGQDYPVGITQMKKLYQEQNYDKWNYINGHHYQPYHNSRETSPYINYKFGEGTVYINGNAYHDLVLAYDIYKDELINIPRKRELSTFYVNINKATIDSFSITIMEGKHHLVNTNKHTCALPDAEGFYEISKHKNFTMFFKHKMALTDDGGIDLFVYALQKKLLINGQIYSIKSKSQLLKHFPIVKKEIKKKLRTYEVGFRKLNAVQLIEVLNYIESLQTGKDD